MKNKIFVLSFLPFLLMACQQGAGNSNKPTKTSPITTEKTKNPPAESTEQVPPASTSPSSEKEIDFSQMQLKVNSVLSIALEKSYPGKDLADYADQYTAELSLPEGLPNGVTIERTLFQGEETLSTTKVQLDSSKDIGTHVLRRDTIDLAKVQSLSPVTVEYSITVDGVAHKIAQKVLRNYVIDGTLDLEEKPIFNNALSISNEILEIDNLLFLPAATLVTEGKEITLHVHNLVAFDKAAIVSFDKSLENGKSGGHLQWTVENISGSISVDLRGQKGAPGTKGANRLPDERPAKGIDAAGFGQMRTVYTPGCGEIRPCREVVDCHLTRAAQNGAQGLKGLPGGDGFPGGSGGDFALSTQTPKEKYVISFSAVGGEGGTFGLGGDGGLPGDPGAAFRASSDCTFDGGAAGTQGDKGDPGIVGATGKNGNFNSN